MADLSSLRPGQRVRVTADVVVDSTQAHGLLVRWDGQYQSFAVPFALTDSGHVTVEPLAPAYEVGTIARIEVPSPPNGVAWPVVERVPDGWQSGAHHYPDADVRDVQVITPLPNGHGIRVACPGWPRPELVSPEAPEVTEEPGPGAVVEVAGRRLFHQPTSETDTKQWAAWPPAPGKFPRHWLTWDDIRALGPIRPLLPAVEA